MSWKNKRFYLETVLPEPRDLVFEVARAFVAESLVWRIADTPDGFVASGASFGHAATARFQINPVGSGTKLEIELLVERASPLGFMLFDVGGYYDAQLHRWLTGIREDLDRALGSAALPNAANRHEISDLQSRTSNGPLKIMKAVLIAFSVIAIVFFIIFPTIGIITGHLYLPGAKASGETIDGPRARIISGVILIGSALFLSRIWKWRRGDRPKILFPPN